MYADYLNQTLYLFNNQINKASISFTKELHTFTMSAINGILTSYIDNIVIPSFQQTIDPSSLWFSYCSSYNGGNYTNNIVTNYVFNQVAPGPQGVKGDTGATGTAGTTGATGATGPAGSINSPINNNVAFNQGITVNNSYLTMNSTSASGLAQIHFDTSNGSSYQLLENNNFLLQYYPPAPNQSKYENFIDIDGSNSKLTLGFGDRTAPQHNNNNALVIGPSSETVGQCTLNVPLLMGDSLSGNQVIVWGSADDTADNTTIDVIGGRLELNNKIGLNQGNLAINGSLLTFTTNTNGSLETVLTADNSGLDVTGTITINGEPIQSQPFVPFKSLISFNSVSKNVPISTATSLLSWTLTGSPTYVSMNLTNISLTYNFPDASLAGAATITFFIDSSPTNSYSAVNQQVFSIAITAPKPQGQSSTFTYFNNTINLSATAQTALENYNTLYLKCYMTQLGSKPTPIEFTNINGSATINAYKVNVPITVSPSL
jgi:hypothetical protein